MLPGITGTLLSPSFLEGVLLHEILGGRDWPPVLRGVARWWRRASRTLGPSSSLRAIADTGVIPLFESCGYRILHLEPHGPSLVGTASRDGRRRVALCIMAWDGALDRAWRDTIRTGRVSGARWGVVCSAAKLRIVDASRVWSRRGIDIDLTSALVDERSAATLIALLESVGRTPSCGSLDDFIDRCEQYGTAVSESLGAGVLDSLAALFAELHRSHVPTANSRAVFEQAVTIVYRLLFLLFAEARSLVPVWHEVYREAYTIEALCRRALSDPERRGLWQSLRAISRLAHRGCRAGDLVVTPFNGRLFSPRHTPLAERSHVSDIVIGRTVVCLATTASRGSRERIAYADLGVEQLGAVYERVLEYEPGDGPRTRVLTRTSTDRKTSGSFYTPRSLTEFLVRRALHPLVSGKSAEEILQLRVVDPAMGSGAFLVAACRYLSDALTRALIDEGSLASDSSREERGLLRRQIVQRCLFGVDRNPMAVQLARLSLWLASLAAGRPLTFLDHHLATGDSLIGASLIDLAQAPAPLRSARSPHQVLPLFASESVCEFSRNVLPERFRIAMEPGDTPDAVHDKERALAQLAAEGTTLTRWKDAAHLWCAASFWSRGELTRGIYHDLAGALTGRHGLLRPSQHAAVLNTARRIAEGHRFFHWELEFPEVFFAQDGLRLPDGGFDAVLGNPPWDVIRADDGSRSARDAARTDRRDKLRFFRDSGVYRHQGRGHANSYQLFVERALQLAKPGGRIALIVPAGLASDQGSAALRRALLDDTGIERVIGFDNRQAIFPIHRDVRFLLLTATKGQSADRVSGAFGVTDARWLDELPDAASEDPPLARSIAISRASLESWDHEHAAWPWLAQQADLEIISSVCAAILPLSSPHGWHVTFGRELNATDDRARFAPRGSAPNDSMLPIVEGKHLEPFRARVDQSTHVIAADAAAALIDPARSFARSRLAYRDVASASNRLTLIAARLGAGVISTHTVFCSRDQLSSDAQYCLLALLNSLVANFLVRLRVATHVTTALMRSLRLPRPSSSSPDFRELVRLAKQLEASGIDANSVAYARLNAIAARLYGLSHRHYAHVVSTFPLLSSDFRQLALDQHARAPGPRSGRSGNSTDSKFDE